MKIVFLTEEYVDAFAAYCREALATDEPEHIVYDSVSEEEIRTFLNDPFYQGTTSLLAIDDGQVVAQLEYHFYGVSANNYRMAYVNWVYTLKSHRRQGIAKALFRRFEDECRKNNVNQYYLIQDEDAGEFYEHFDGGSVSLSRIRRKNICE